MASSASPEAPGGPRLVVYQKTPHPLIRGEYNTQRHEEEIEYSLIPITYNTVCRGDPTTLVVTTTLTLDDVLDLLYWLRDGGMTSGGIVSKLEFENSFPDRYHSELEDIMDTLGVVVSGLSSGRLTYKDTPLGKPCAGGPDPHVSRRAWRENGDVLGFPYDLAPPPRKGKSYASAYPEYFGAEEDEDDDEMHTE